MKIRKCSYFLCGNTKSNKPSLRMFTFPVKDENRCEQWIINSGNMEVLNALPFETLKWRFLCADHFKPEDMMKRTLRPGALPIPYNFRTEDCVTYGPSKGAVEKKTVAPHSDEEH